MAVHVQKSTGIMILPMLAASPVFILIVQTPLLNAVVATSQYLPFSSFNAVFLRIGIGRSSSWLIPTP